jgi:hypothetical protein
MNDLDTLRMWLVASTALRFLYCRVDARDTGLWFLYAAEGKPGHKELAGLPKRHRGGDRRPIAPAANAHIVTGWVGVEVPGSAIVDRAAGGDRHPITLDKAYRIDLDAVEAAWKLTPSGWRRMPWRPQ